jgi:septal ring factor EnvC (AmiA/AmiB activator)
MRRLRLLLLITGVPLVAAASAPVQDETPPIDVALEQARAEAQAADAQVQRFEATAANARDAAAQMRARQAAAAEAISAAEARISAADAQQRIIAASLSARRARLAEQERPVASLLAGLAMMARRPPLLALAGDTSTDELVRVRLLLNATLPVIRRRTVALSNELAEGERLEQSATAARAALLRSRNELAQRRREFATLEARALQQAASSGSAALGAGDVALASGEMAEQLAGEAQRTRSAAQVARELAALGPPPPRPAVAEGGLPRPPFDYRLPAAARVVTGLGEISDSGVRSRGLTLATRRGAAGTVAAAGVVRFSGPFRDYDGVVIIDHGGGWMSLILDVVSPLKPGDRVAVGAPLGRALGPIGVELSRSGQHWSPALIAGSSQSLSNKGKGG